MRRLTLRTAGALLWAAGLSFVVPIPASAHAELIVSTPAAGSSLPEAPKQLTMTFSEGIDPITASVQLLNENGGAVPGLGAPTVHGATTLEVSLPQLPAALYTVSYRVTSAEDGHISEGSWLFLVDPTGTRAPPGSSPESTSLSSRPLIVATRWLALAFGIVLLGTAVFWLASARPALAAGNAESPVAMSAPWLWIAACGALTFTGLAAYLTLAAQPLVGAGGHPGHGGGIVPLDFAAPFGATRFAMAMRVALIGSGIAFLLAIGRYFTLDEARRRLRVPRDRERSSLLLVALAAAISLAGSSLASHAASVGGLLFGAFDWLHLVAVSIWLGTLPGLIVLARRSRAERKRSTVLAALRRHSRLAIVAAPVVALTGIANSPLLLGSDRNLVATDYGDLLVAKALLFSTAIAIGAANFFLVRAGSARRILPLIVGEAAIGALAVMVAATLVSTQPAASRAPVLSRPAIGAEQLFGDTANATIHVSVNLPSPGLQRYQATVADLTTGIPWTDVEGITLVFSPPADAGTADERVRLLQSDQTWLWGITGNYTPSLGDWKLGVEVQRGGKQLATTFPLQVVALPAPEVVPAPATGISVPAPLAVVWAILPRGPLGWLVPILLLCGIAALALWERQRPGVGTGGWRVVLALLLLMTGLAMEARTSVEAANAPPATAAQAVNPIPASPDSLARGRSLYLANCSSCHGVDGRGDGPGAGDLLPLPGNLADVVPGLSQGALDFRITYGMVGTAMPSFAGSLTQNDRWDLVNYLRGTWPLR
ncbi:MAG TPA: copper resistance protein CopC [Candidatus Saccharimonadales bacterium]|nr:copper resistance protein CopC [Candidatus Saccharimonadales bacterium]